MAPRSTKPALWGRTGALIAAALLTFAPASSSAQSPRSDEDADGIDDAMDMCPQDPEDIDGFEDTDGCPEPDNDGDGIPDLSDQCLMEPETINGIQDEDGCPDETPPLAIYGAPAIELREQIYFEPGQAFPFAQSDHIVDEIAAVLAQNPQLKFEVLGHSCAGADDDVNLSLSRARAEEIRARLVADGVSAANLTPRGHGCTRPIAPNTTADGRAKNERVDFVVIPGN